MNTLKNLFKNYWLLVLSTFLLILMSLPLFHFSTILHSLSPQFIKKSNERNGSIQIGICLNCTAETRWMRERQIWLQAAKDLNINTSISVANNSSTRQINQFISLCEQGAKVIIINPVNSRCLKELITEAKRRSVRIICYDDAISEARQLYQGFDYNEVGVLQAKTLISQTGPGNYVVLKGPRESLKSQALFKGQMKTINPYRREGIKVIAEVALTDDWSAETAVAKIKQILLTQKIDAILAPNDLIAEEVIRFYKEQRLPIPPVTGAGAELGACKRILAQEQCMTVYLDYARMAGAVFASAVDILQNKKATRDEVEKVFTLRIPDNIRHIYLINKSNLSSLLVGKFKIYSRQELGLE